MVGQQLSLSAAAHRNQRLFSDHYLDEFLPKSAEWRAGADGAAGKLEELREIWRRFTPSSKEAQTEEELVRPVLRALGHTFEVQAALKTPDGPKFPDYVLYRDEEALRGNKERVLDETLLRGGGLAVADAKYWERPLDQALRVGKDPFTNKNPGYQISFYMQHSGLPWGILTNGRQWRLYHKDSAHKLDRFYEVDLPELLEGGDPAQFQYFLRFFERAAFEPGPLSLERHLSASESYARSVGQGLREQVYEALLHVAQGFLDYPDNGLQADSPTLKAIYDHSLILLYRILFVLYAEARELQPVQESTAYRERYGLCAIKRDVARDMDLGFHLQPGSALQWPRLQQLFRYIDLGSPPLKIATFNGGLFDPERHPFLERYTVGDAHLQEAIDRLARVEKELVDYRDLSERHLGTIYEGLLEFQLRPLETGPDAPAEDAQAAKAGWSVKLVTDKGERKASGSYYTPGFITRFMVEQAVGPVVDRALQAGDAEARVQAVLNVNVLDCSMGSGHFLVEATEYLARRLVEADVVPAGLPEAARADFDELAYWKRRVAQSCIYGVDLNPLAVDLAKLSLWLTTAAKERPLSFLDHHLRTGNALVGARLEELSLPGGAEKKRRGKAKQEKQEAAGQLTWAADSAFKQSMGLAVGNLWLIEENPAETVSDVKTQEKLYDQVRETFTRKYSRVMDLAVARHFGLQIDEWVWPTLVEHAAGRTLARMPKFEAWEREAQQLAAQHRFFHWELEFPEVFFDRHGRNLGDEAGFDVVIGNPPYVRQELLAPVKPYLQKTYETYHGAADLYVYFYERGLALLQIKGRMSYIVTNKWLRSGYGEPLRRYLGNRHALEMIIDFGHAPIFEDVDVFPCILLFEKPSEPTEHTVAVTTFPREVLRQVELGTYIRNHKHAVPHRRFGAAPWSLEPGAVDALIDKIRSRGVPLRDFAGLKPFRGVVTGFNEAFLISDEVRQGLINKEANSGDVIYPYLRGQDIKRWLPQWQGLWMIFTRRGIDIDRYPAIKEHLSTYYKQLCPRVGIGAGRKPGSYQWYEIQDSVDYWELFKSPKIVYQEIQFHPSYCLDTQGYFTNNKAFILPKPDLYILAVLNSPLMWWYNWRYLPHMKDEALSPVADLMEKLPIASPTDEVRSEVEPRVSRLLEITQDERARTRGILAWLRLEFGVEAPGQKLQLPAALEQSAFVEEVRRVRPKAAGRLTPSGIRELCDTYDREVLPLRQLAQEKREVETRLSDLVNSAYGLTAEEVALMWTTAPPRMPHVDRPKALVPEEIRIIEETTAYRYGEG